MNYLIPEMSCAHCKTAIEKAVMALDPTAEVAVDLDSHRARIDTARPVSEVLAVLRDAGYEATAA